MNGRGKSDSPVVPEKPSNNGGGAPPLAERVEGKGLAEGNSGQRNGYWTQRQGSPHSKLDRVREVEFEQGEGAKRPRCHWGAVSYRAECGSALSGGGTRA